ncbi:MAG: sugar ABC transporter substrate-binding protein [Eubacteriales bacterium]
MKKITSNNYVIGIIVVILILLIGTVNYVWKSQRSLENNSSVVYENSKQTIELVHYYTVEDIEKYAEMYNESQDAVEVVCTYVSREDLSEVYSLGAVSGNLPDIGMSDSSDMQSWISLGIFEDISEELYDWEDIEQFHQTALSTCIGSDNNLYGLPVEMNSLALVVNLDILEASGITELPQTWEEFLYVCEETTQVSKGIYGFAMSACANEEGTFQYIPWLYSAGADYTTLDSEQGISSMEFLTNLVDQGYMSKEIVNWEQRDVYSVFCEGKTAMAEIGSWNVNNIEEDIAGEFEYQIIHMPSDEREVMILGGEVFGVCIESEVKEECIDFLKFLISKDMNEEWCLNNGALPVREDSRNANEIWNSEGEYGIFVDGLDDAICRGPDESWMFISSVIYEALQKSILGEGSVELIMQDAQNNIDSVIQ